MTGRSAGRNSRRSDATDGGGIIPPDQTTFARWGRVSRGWSPVTAYNYARRIHICEAWMQTNRQVPLTAAQPADIELMLIDSTNESTSWRNGAHAALRAFYAFTRLTNPDQPDPTDHIARVKVRPPVPRALDPAACRAVLDASREVGGMWAAMVAVLMYGALRRAEARRLMWADIEGDNQWLRVLGKGHDERIVPLHQAARRELLRWRVGGAEASAWMFPSPADPQQPVSGTTIAKWLHRIGEIADVPLTPHVLRHSAATRMVEQGVDVRTLQAILGHRSLQATQVYLRARPERTQAAVATLDF